MSTMAVVILNPGGSYSQRRFVLATFSSKEKAQEYADKVDQDLKSMGLDVLGPDLQKDLWYGPYLIGFPGAYAVVNEVDHEPEFMARHNSNYDK